MGLIQCSKLIWGVLVPGKPRYFCKPCGISFQIEDSELPKDKGGNNEDHN